MKKIAQLVKGIEIISVHGQTLLNCEINNIQTDHKKINSNDLYTALIGYGINGHNYISNAIKKGASVIVCSELPDNLIESITYIIVNDTYKAISKISANYYENPSEHIKVIGVTGTNGKTSTVTLLHQLYRKLNYKCGLISTICNKINDKELSTDKTTPVSLDLQRLLREMVEAECQYCFMECSSHGIFQSRVSEISFMGAVFTNITHEHLDYHGSFEEYYRVKKSFLDSLPHNAFIIYNKDDFAGSTIISECKAKCISVSLKDIESHFHCTLLKDDLKGLNIKMHGRDIKLQLIGAFNCYNILATVAVAVSMGVNIEEVLDLLPILSPVTGRFDAIKFTENIIGIIDYAHTPDAYEKLYGTICKIKKNRIISIIGFNGQRDSLKRPMMAKIASKYSDHLIITSDNPDWEDPQKIVKDALEGVEGNLSNVHLIEDRRLAIKFAISLAKPYDIILLLGKGPDNYQKIKGIIYPFNDKEILIELMESK